MVHQEMIHLGSKLRSRNIEAQQSHSDNVIHYTTVSLKLNITGLVSVNTFL